MLKILTTSQKIIAACAAMWWSGSNSTAIPIAVRTVARKHRQRTFNAAKQVFVSAGNPM
jgi:hypothetical protein